MPKRPLAPRFITQLDDYLLKNRPDTWTTRIHLVIYYWLLFSIALSVICFAIPDNPLRDSNVGFWTTATSVLIIVGIVLWIIYLVRFNTFKNYGSVSPGDRIKNYFFFFISLVLICSTAWIPSIIETYKTMIRYSPSHVVEDMNQMNILLARLVKADAPAEVTVDSIYIIDYSSYIPKSPSGTYNWDDSLGAYVKTPIYLSRDELKWTLTQQDSVVWITTDKLLRFQVTNLQFISNYRIEQDEAEKMLTSFDIYNKVYNNDVPEDIQKLEREYFAIAERYIDPRNDYDNYWNYSSDPNSIAAHKYNTNTVSRGIDNICERIYRWKDNEILAAFHVLYYVAMFIALCLFVFRHSTLRTFFLSILAGILLAIITGVFAAFLELREEGLLIIAMVYFAFFLVFSLSTIQSRVRSVFTGIALNLAVICTPFIPLFIVLLYYELNPVPYYDYTYGYDDDIYEDFQRNRLMWLYISEIFGFVMILVLSETVYKWMFRKWYAAPEE